MSTEKGAVGASSSSQAKTPLGKKWDEGSAKLGATQSKSQSKLDSPPNLKEERRERAETTKDPEPALSEDERKPPAKKVESLPASAATGASLESTPRQVIAVSASKGPAAFFNLARKFLVTDEMCDLSALEGAIVSAVDAAHLLERSKLATIVRVQTSYVTVEPKRKKQAPQQEEQEQEEGGTQSVPGPSSSEATGSPSRPASAQTSVASPEHEEEGRAPAGLPPARQGARGSSSGGRELRRARIVITVKRTESYKRWLEENPLQAIIAGDADEADPERTLREPK